MSLVKFIKGPYASYNPTDQAGAIYFATDQGVIYVDNVPYGAQPVIEDPEVVRSVENVTLGEDGKTLTIAYTVGDPKTLDLTIAFPEATDDTNGLMSAADKKNLDALAALLNEAGVVELSTNYTSGIEDTALAMPDAVGGFAKGTTVADLNGKSYNQMFDDLLFPSVDPEHGNPSLTGFALNPSTSPVEIGTAVASVSEAGLNKATWTAYNNGLAYAGDVTSTVYTININGTTYTDIAALPATYNTLGAQTYKAVVNYGAGPTPVNNKGDERPTMAAPAGSVSVTRTVNVTAPWYASTVTAGELTKQSLITWNATAGAMQAGANGVGFEVKPHTAAAPQMFKLPRKATNLQMYNSVAKAFETVSLTEWVETSATEQINGVDQMYYIYTYNGAARGAVKLIVKF